MTNESEKPGIEADANENKTKADFTTYEQQIVQLFAII